MKANLFVLVLALSVPCLTAQEREPDYYPLKPGTKWHYQVTVQGKVVKVTNEIEKTELVNGEALALQKTLSMGVAAANEHLKSDRSGVYRQKFNGIDLKPPLCLLKYPVKSGDTWKVDHQAGGMQTTGNATVGNMEDVQVLAGKYKAVPVTMTTTIMGQNVNTTYWFAVNVGIVKQTATFGGLNMSMELEKVEMPK